MSLSEFYKDYVKNLKAALDAAWSPAVEQACLLIQHTSKAGGHIYSAGNGGSAAIADHLCCDWMKNTALPGHPPVHVHSLVSNVALNTAFSNDLGYEEGLSTHLRLVASKGDLLVLISSSGKSPNILKAARVAKEMGVQIIGLSGFDGGGLKDLADVSIHVPSRNYGIVEDTHQAVMHVLSQYIVQIRS